MIALGRDTSNSARVLDNFKKEEYAILFENASLKWTGSNDVLEKEYIMNGLEWLKKKLQNMESEYTDKKAAITERRLTLEEALTSLENAINDTYDGIVRAEKSLAEKDSRIEWYQTLSIELSERIDKNRAIILGYLANIYSESSLLFDKENKLDVLQAMIISGNSVDALSQDMLYKSLVNVLGQKFIDEYKSLVREYYRTAMKIKEEKVLIEEERSSLEKQKATLASQRNQRQALLDVTKGQEALFESYIESQRQAQEEVENSWKSQSDAYIASLDTLMEKNGCKTEKPTSSLLDKCDRIGAFYKNERELRKLDIDTAEKNPLFWPMRTTPEISTYFRDPSYYRSFGSQHDAIDIVLAQGSDVLASMDGYVYYMLPPSPGGYSYLALRHPGWYVTVYGHLSDIVVKPYQFVKKGDLIAKSWGAPGTPGAGPMTSGAHLHFEVYQNEKAIDPLRVLDISQIAYEALPVRYQDKFLTDMSERVGVKAPEKAYERTFVLRGESEEDRQKYLLKTYASREFNDWDTWVDSALEARIDPSFLMCVGLAETTLGNYLKTPYNIGNVGNTDSGDTVTFASAKGGIDAMASTFNNKFLWSYTLVSELSRWGNSDGTIYASSNANWHNNIIRCLSSLKWRFVEDDYIFRRN